MARVYIQLTQSALQQRGGDSAQLQTVDSSTADRTTTATTAILQDFCVPLPFSLFFIPSLLFLSFSTLLQQHTGTHNILVVKQPLIAISIHVRLPSFRYSPVSSVSASAFRRKNTDEAIFSDKANSQQLTNCGHRQKSKLSTKHNDTILYQAQLSTSEYTLTLDNESHESV
jgi:hypothetical protein